MCARQLRRGYRIFLDITVDLNANTTSVIKLVRASPFRTRFMKELAMMLTLPLCGVTNENMRHCVTKLLKLVFSCWGQTKVVEDVFKNCRQREHQDSLNGPRIVSAY